MDPVWNRNSNQSKQNMTYTYIAWIRCEIVRKKRRAPSVHNTHHPVHGCILCWDEIHEIDKMNSEHIIMHSWVWMTFTCLRLVPMACGFQPWAARHKAFLPGWFLFLARLKANKCVGLKGSLCTTISWCTSSAGPKAAINYSAFAPIGLRHWNIFLWSTGQKLFRLRLRWGLIQ